MKRIRIEVCVGGLADALLAAACGADRLEISVSLEVDGLTPPLTLVEEVLNAVRVPVVALVRCRPGGFEYGPDEIAAMAEQAAALARLGVEGVAIGAVSADGSPDAAGLGRIASAARDAAPGVRLVGHRAFDRSRDLGAAAETLASLGMCRVLTSGGAATALDGSRAIAEVRARGALEPVPAGGVRAANLREIGEATGCGWVHGSFRRAGGPPVRLDEAGLRAAVRAANGQGLNGT